MLDKAFKLYFCLSEIKTVKDINVLGDSNVVGWMHIQQKSVMTVIRKNSHRFSPTKLSYLTAYSVYLVLKYVSGQCIELIFQK